MKFAWKRFKELSGPERRVLLDRTPSDEEAEAAVRPILDAVAREGDGAVRTWSEKLDGVRLESLRVPEEEISRAVDAMPKAFFDALETARRNIEIFHTAEKPPSEVTAAPQDGVELRRLWRPFERVGFYIPGGGASYPSTVLMLAVPARVAGCRDVALASPPDREGRVAQATLATARFTGVEEVYRIGGAMAVGAFAYGTRSVPAVEKIFGPGSRYVDAAKRLVACRTAVDLPAGPSEVLVLADESAEPRFCAADLLSQAEHGPDSIAVLVTTSERVARETASEVERQLEKSPRREILEAALRRLRLLVVDSIDEAVALANDFAPEHMVLMVEAEDEVLGGVRCAGSVLLGSYSPVAAGDYAAGINHVLPTGGAARTRSALSVLDFGRMMQVSRISRSGLEALRGAIVTLAEIETLAAHAEAVKERVR
jgi:histidinol dehydrogenase